MQLRIFWINRFACSCSRCRFEVVAIEVALCKIGSRFHVSGDLSISAVSDDSSLRTRSDTGPLIGPIELMAVLESAAGTEFADAAELAKLGTDGSTDPLLENESTFEAASIAGVVNDLLDDESARRSAMRTGPLARRQPWFTARLFSDGGSGVSSNSASNSDSNSCTAEA